MPRCRPRARIRHHREGRLSAKVRILRDARTVGAHNWAGLTRAAEEAEARHNPAKTWVPPIAGALFAVASRSRLAELDPFTSLTRVCFQSSSPDGAIAPAHIQIGPESVYYVFDRRPYDGPTDPVLSTADLGGCGHSNSRVARRVHHSDREVAATRSFASGHHMAR
jgi:hypothetical protein